MPKSFFTVPCQKATRMDREDEPAGHERKSEAKNGEKKRHSRKNANPKKSRSAFFRYDFFFSPKRCAKNGERSEPTPPPFSTCPGETG